MGDEVTDAAAKAVRASGLAVFMAPLRERVFRKVWLASLLTNLGLMIGGVGTAWAMTQLAAGADLVALVQTAMLSPQMLGAVAAGAMADMYDRRLVGVVALVISFVGAASMAALAFFGLMTPQGLLALTFVIGLGVALFGPSWQASVSEQVSPEALPAAIALNGISYNVARSFGPAVGGVVVALAGAVSAFALNAAAYIPLLVVFLTWRRVREVSRLPPERLGSAMVSGLRYVIHSPRIRVVLARTVMAGLIGAAILALMPLVAKELLGGGAPTYGLLLCAFGFGAVLGALASPSLRQRLSSEGVIRLCAILMGGATILVGASRTAWITGPALIVIGAGWMITVTMFNIGVQISAPRWVAGRALSTYQMSITGGLAIGSWAWGTLADRIGVDHVLMCAGGLMFVLALVGIWLRMPVTDRSPQPATPLDEPEVNLDLTLRSGPIVVELEYRVALADARKFYGLMQQVQLFRQRNGGYDWSIARDIAEPEVWTERFTCPTWLDYLRQRDRPTQAERALQDRARELHLGDEPVRVRRWLERPYGSVRWKEETPDLALDQAMPSQQNTAGG